MKVRCINNKSPINMTHPSTIGKIYHILDENRNDYKIHNYSGYDCWYMKERFEEIEEKTMKEPKRELGNIVELKDGTRGLVVGNENFKTIYWAVKGGHNNYVVELSKNIALDLDKFIENALKSNNLKRIYEGICKERPSMGLSFNIYSEYQKLLWEYKPKVEVTLEQIAEKFGTTVDQLEIKGYE